jgi:membrane protein YdbS with pleckstrin-like domain
MLGVALAAYVFSWFNALSPNLRSSGTGITIILVVIFLISCSIVHSIVGVLMAYRYRENLLSDDVKILHKLHFEERNVILKVVIYKHGLWLTD